MAACANCGNQNLPGQKFCTSCGKPLAATSPALPAAVVGQTCPWCGASIPEAVKFCIKCGKPLLGGAPPPLGPPAPIVAGRPPLAPPAPIVATPPPPSLSPLVPSGGLTGTQEAPHPAAFTAPPGPPPGPRKSAAGMIVAAVIVLAALGGGGYYGYSRWKAKEAPPQNAAAPRQPPAADQVPQAHAAPAAPPPAEAPSAQEPAAAAASTAQPFGKPDNTPAASVSTERVPPALAQLPGRDPAPPYQAPAPVAPAVPPQASAPPEQTIVLGNVQAAKLIRQIPPVYPPLAIRARISGAVVLRLVVAGDGTVKDVSVISGNQFLTQAAMDAARQWLYKPTLLNGAPVEVLTEATINFRLSGQ